MRLEDQGNNDCLSDDEAFRELRKSGLEYNHALLMFDYIQAYETQHDLNMNVDDEVWRDGTVFFRKKEEAIAFFGEFPPTPLIENLDVGWVYEKPLYPFETEVAVSSQSAIGLDEKCCGDCCECCDCPHC